MSAHACSQVVYVATYYSKTVLKIMGKRSMQFNREKLMTGLGFDTCVGAQYGWSTPYLIARSEFGPNRSVKTGPNLCCIDDCQCHAVGRQSVRIISKCDCHNLCELQYTKWYGVDLCAILILVTNVNSQWFNYIRITTWLMHNTTALVLLLILFSLTLSQSQQTSTPQ